MFGKKNISRSSSIILLFVFGLFCSCQQKNNEVSTFSKKVMDETLLNTKNEEIAFGKILKENEGKIVLIEIWASWCGDCIGSMPKVKKIQEKHPNLNYLFISMDKTVDQWLAGIERYSINGQHFMAKDQMTGIFADALEVDWIPRYLLVDKTGKIVIYHAIESDLDAVEKKITELEQK